MGLFQQPISLYTSALSLGYKKDISIIIDQEKE